MTLLVAGLVLFFVPHLLPVAAGPDTRIRNALSENAYKGIFSLIAGAGLVMIIVGYGRAPFESVYTPPAWGWRLNMVLMAPALVLIVAAYAPNNIKRVTAHPMLWGTFLWAVGHLLANGDLASVLLFGSFGVYPLVDMWSANSRGVRPSMEKKPPAKDATVVLLGLILYAIFYYLHGYLFGVPLA